MNTRRRLPLLLLAVGYANQLQYSYAAFTFLGPIPYLSAADSPFPIDGSNPTFFLEDFEDGVVNLPGISDAANRIFSNGLRAPSSTTDSVDGDDGAIDGSGTGGWALRGGLSGPFGPSSGVNGLNLRFEFSADELGFYPNAFGIVWTDGTPPSRVNIGAWNDQLIPIGGDGAGGLGDSSILGETMEDRFFGFTTNESIAVLVVSISHLGKPEDFELFTEIDHIQYGRLIPAPPGYVVFTWFLVGWVVCVRKRF
ncbi:hypothetical protein OAS39_12310 [Pirellulales bacterium]|nr:hypothetical protein [Pirellulales bacterium]